MYIASLTDEDKLLLDRVDDFISGAEEKYTNQFSHFLDQRQSYIAIQHLKFRKFSNYLLWGGSEDCERQMLGIFSEYCQPEQSEFPLSAATLTFRREDSLSHRDFLGAIMNLRIKREAVGDILVSDGLAVVFSEETVSTLIEQEITKIGRVGVKVFPGMPYGIPSPRGFEDIEGTVSSMRLDCIISLLTRLSREKSAELIRSGAVSVMFSPCEDISLQVEPDFKISIRGYGRFIIHSAGGFSRKGRLHVVCKKYL